MSALDGQDLYLLTKHIVGKLRLTHDDASEALSVGIVAAVEGLQKWEADDPAVAASTYVTNAVRWAILSYLRTEQRVQKKVVLALREAPAQPWSTDPSRDFIDYTDVNAALGRMESKERDVLSAVAFGFSMPEICRRFRVNPAAIQTARKHFVTLVAEEA